MNISIVDPTSYRGWDEQILAFPDYSFFHSAAWARVLREAYGYRPCYFVLAENGTITAAIPLMEVESVLTGKRGVSLPFSDTCDPLVRGLEYYKELVKRIIEYGKRRNWKYLEFRGGGALMGDSPPSCTFLEHMLELSMPEEQLLSSFRKGTKSAVKKAAAEGVEASIHDKDAALEEFYRLNCLTRQRHGLPPQPYQYFKILQEMLISKGMGFVVLGTYQGRTIAASVFLHFGKKALYKYGASDPDFQYLRANNIVVWEAIKRYLRNGLEAFDFGRTEPHNEGLRIFKAGWNTKESAINYYRYDLSRDSFTTNTTAINPLFNTIFNKMPVSALRLLGNFLYRHMA